LHFSRVGIELTEKIDAVLALQFRHNSSRKLLQMVSAQQTLRIIANRWAEQEVEKVPLSIITMYYGYGENRIQEFIDTMISNRWGENEHTDTTMIKFMSENIDHHAIWNELEIVYNRYLTKKNKQRIV
jgi:hypothetical protein